jgi:hypothetical protein
MPAEQWMHAALPVRLVFGHPNQQVQLKYGVSNDAFKTHHELA